MRAKINLIGRTVLFLFLGLNMFFKIQSILMPGPAENRNNHEQTWNVIHGINVLGVDDLDVLFLGASHVRFGISPMELYENYGILSYNFATSSQPIEGSCFLLEKAYESHNIKTVVFDVSMLFHDSNNESWRKILDNLPFGDLKYRMSKEYTAKYKEESVLSVMFPLIKYHSNWENIKRTNFYPVREEIYYTMGQGLENMTVPSPFQLDDVTDEAQISSEYNVGRCIEIISGKAEVKEIQSALYAPLISNERLNLLFKLKALCEEHGSRLLLIKVPTLYTRQWYEGSWDKIKSEAVSAVAKEYQIPFLDLLYDVDSIVSFDTDTMDGGLHLNMFGAEKVSYYLGSYLLDHNFAVKKSNLIYSEALAKYQKVYTVAAMQKINDFREYLIALKGWLNNKMVVIVAQGDYITGLEDEDYALLNDLGLSLISQGEYRDSYAAIISNGQMLYEALSDYEIKYSTKVVGAVLEIDSRNGWLKSPGAHVRINGKEYSQSYTGLNIIIFDDQTGCILDNVAFNTSESSKYSMRDKSWTHNILKDYESVLCFDGR